MPNEKQANELRAIVKGVKEHLTFLNELGVERIDHGVMDQTTTSDSIDELPTVGPAKAPAGLESPTPDKSVATEQASSFSLKLGSPSLPAMELGLTRSAESLEDVWNETRDCTRCPLWEGRTHVVNSEGNRQAQLMFVGEAPGADEDAQARPFVGRAGQLLNKIIESIGLKREDVFIGNVNRCRPPSNRTPTPAEGLTCKPFIIREIDIILPKVIVVLGNVATKNLLDTKEGITKLRGKFQDYRGIKVMPTFHPAYLLRDPSKKRETWEDMKTVRDYLNSINPDD